MGLELTPGIKVIHVSKRGSWGGGGELHIYQSILPAVFVITVEKINFHDIPFSRMEAILLIIWHYLRKKSDWLLVGGVSRGPFLTQIGELVQNCNNAIANAL